MNTEDMSTTTATNPAQASTQKATPKRTARRPGQTLASGEGLPGTSGGAFWRGLLRAGLGRVGGGGGAHVLGVHTRTPTRLFCANDFSGPIMHEVCRNLRLWARGSAGLVLRRRGLGLGDLDLGGVGGRAGMSVRSWSWCLQG